MSATTAVAFMAGIIVGQVFLMLSCWLFLRVEERQVDRWTLPDPETTLTPPPLSLRRSQGKPVRLRWPS